MAKTEDEIKAYVLRRLGNSIVEIELAAEDLNDIISDTKRWFATRVGSKDVREVQLLKNNTVYKLEDDVVEVLNIWLPSTSFPAVDTDDFSYTYSLLFGQWRSPGASPMPYSDLVQRLQYLKTSSKIFSADRDWKFTHGTRELEIMPAPSIIGPALIEIWTSNIDTRTLHLEDDDLFMRYALAEGQIRLGEIRNTFAQYTTVAGERGLNGASLIKSGMEARELLNRQALTFKWRPGFIIG